MELGLREVPETGEILLQLSRLNSTVHCPHRYSIPNPLVCLCEGSVSMLRDTFTVLVIF